MARSADVGGSATQWGTRTMTHTRGRPTVLPGLGLIFGLAILLMACGGGAAPSAGAAGGAATSDAPGSTDASAASPERAASEAPPASEAAAASEPSTGGGTDACGLVSVAEMEGIFGVSGVTQQLFPGPPDTCDYQLDSAPFVAIVDTPAAAGPVFDAMAADAASETVPGIGDRALYNSQMLTFLIQRGDRLLAIQVLDESRTEEERLELMKQIGAIAAGRM